MTNCVALRHVAFEDAGLIAPLMAARGIDLAYIEAGGHGELDAAEAADLLVVLGGPIGVYDTADYPFLTGEIAMLEERLAARKPTLGICLGAQLIAAALGAHVAPGPAKEIGYAPLDLTDEGRASVLAPLEGVAVLHWHGDNLELPAGAVRLASTRVCPVQAFSIGTHALGLQFHLETEPRQLERWLIGHAAELAQARIAPPALRAQAAAHGAATVAAGARVLEKWLAGALP